MGTPTQTTHFDQHTKVKVVNPIRWDIAAWTVNNFVLDNQGETIPDVPSDGGNMGTATS